MTLKPINQCACVAMINGCVVHDGLLSESKIISFKSSPLDGPIDIKIIVTRQHPEAVEVNLAINGYEIIPLYQDTVATPRTSYLDFNGEWTLHIPNFYSWYHNISGQGWIA